MAAILAIATYALCRMLFPAPSGALLISLSLSSVRPPYSRDLSREDPHPKRMATVKVDEQMLPDREYLFMDPLAKSWVSFNWAAKGAESSPFELSGFWVSLR